MLTSNSLSIPVFTSGVLLAVFALTAPCPARLSEGPRGTYRGIYGPHQLRRYPGVAHACAAGVAVMDALPLPVHLSISILTTPIDHTLRFLCFTLRLLTFRSHHHHQTCCQTTKHKPWGAPLGGARRRTWCTQAHTPN